MCVCLSHDYSYMPLPIVMPFLINAYGTNHYRIDVYVRILISFTFQNEFCESFPQLRALSEMSVELLVTLIRIPHVLVMIYLVGFGHTNSVYIRLLPLLVLC